MIMMMVTRVMILMDNLVLSRTSSYNLTWKAAVGRKTDPATLKLLWGLRVRCLDQENDDEWWSMVMKMMALQSLISPKNIEELLHGNCQLFDLFWKKRPPLFWHLYQSWSKLFANVGHVAEFPCMMSYKAIFFILEAINYYILLSHFFVMFLINSPSSLSLSVLYARPSSPCSLGLPSPASHRWFMFSIWWEKWKTFSKQTNRQSFPVLFFLFLAPSRGRALRRLWCWSLFSLDWQSKMLASHFGGFRDTFPLFYMILL